eukprot:gene4122-biopygen2321
MRVRPGLPLLQRRRDQHRVAARAFMHPTGCSFCNPSARCCNSCAAGHHPSTCGDDCRDTPWEDGRSNDSYDVAAFGAGIDSRVPGGNSQLPPPQSEISNLQTAPPYNPSDVEVRCPIPAPVRPRRAPVLLHHHRRPVRVHRVGVLDQRALPAAAAVRVRPAAPLIRPHQLGEGVGRGAGDPHPLAVRGAAVARGVLRPVPGRRDVLALVPRLEHRGVAPLPVAVPIVRDFHLARVPIAREGGRS